MSASDWINLCLYPVVYISTVYTMKNRKFIPAFVILAVSSTIMCTDLYLPAMPSMVDFFNSTENMVQNSIAAYLFGLVISALVYGPISDSYGRRPLLLIGFAAFLLSSTSLIFTSDIDMFILLRFIQGCGGGVSIALGPAIIRDCFNEKESSKVIAQMSIVILLTPAIAPILGGYLTTYFGWQSCFKFITAVVFLAFVCISLLFPETTNPEKRPRLNIKNIATNYLSLFTNQSFMLFVLVHSLPSAALWCLITVMPFIYINHMDVETHNFGFYIFTQIMVSIAGSYYVQRVVIEKGPIVIMQIGIKLAFLGSFTLLMSSLLAPTSAICAILSVFPFVLSIQFLFPTSMAKAMSYGGATLGIAASCVVTSRQLFSSIGSMFASAFPESSFAPTAILIAFVACFTATALYKALESSAKIEG